MEIALYCKNNGKSGKSKSPFFLLFATRSAFLKHITHTEDCGRTDRPQVCDDLHHPRKKKAGYTRVHLSSGRPELVGVNASFEEFPK